jgi:membrane-bound inhibitor of C-type lysozyme
MHVRGLATVALLALVAAGVMLPAMPARSETYYYYRCENGAEFEVALFPDTRAAYIQLDGKALTLPKFFSITGTRYRRAGITFWFRGERATIRRGGVRSECRRQGPG